MATFKLPPISTLAGSDLLTYIKVLKGNHIERKYYNKVILTGLISAVGTPFQLIDKIGYDKKLKDFRFEESPVFILGHWRSGTTFLHNLLCRDPRSGYITTYQSIFPNHLYSKWLFKTFLKANIPEKRPSDNVRLSADYPQEDEFTMGNLNPVSYYHFWYFPKRRIEFYEKYVRFSSIPDKKLKVWKNTYVKLIKKSLLNTSGNRAIIKNPVNTARIKTLLEIFPEGKFIYLYRNPVIVYLSTLKFFTELFPTLWFYPITESEIQELVLDTYLKLWKDYQESKYLIPKGNLIEIKFEEFEREPLNFLKNIYGVLNLAGYDESKDAFDYYIKSLIDYKKNTYKIKEEELRIVSDKWNETITNWGYDIPENLEILN